MKKNNTGLVPIMDKVSSLLGYIVVAVEVIEFAKQKYNDLQDKGTKPEREAVESDAKY